MNRDKHDLCHFFDFHGPLYAYLGHFADPAVLKAGHNTSSDEDDAAATDKMIEEYGAGRLEGSTSNEPQGA